MSAANVTAVVASAGAGKTTRIVSEIAAEVSRRDPERIVATTFTTKAAAELIERSRAALYAAGRSDEAGRLLGARFGTVNAVCGQIVAEHAIALGRSPTAEVIPEEAVARTFAIAADTAIERHAPRLNELADAMGFFEPKRAADAERGDWRTTVRRIIELARANGIAAEDLSASAERSASSFLELLPALSRETGEALDEALEGAVREALALVPSVLSATAKSSVETLRRASACLDRRERLSWPDWARLSKVTCARKDGQPFGEAMLAVCHAAGRHPEHPRLRQDCVDLVRTIFSCAADALASYQHYKSERGLLDFIDQEALALEVLRDPAMSARLAERIGRVFVDEFQDSSPLQIAIFTELSRLAEASTWVGDPKQAIYGFRNADSALTQAAFAGVASTASGPQEVLATSYRSRAGIVDFANAVFGPAFEAMGLPGAEHLFAGTARTGEGFSRQPLSVWWLEGRLELQYAALAGAVQEALDAEPAWEVGDRLQGVRPMRPGDVAILCRSRADIAKVSMALARQGLKVAVEREGLSRTPHVEFVMAAFRWVVDPADQLALAELARFFADDPRSDAWLTAAASDDPDAALGELVPIAGRLIELRQALVTSTPAEMVDTIILLPELARRIEAWGDVAGRLDDLEALRGFARRYEAGCRTAGLPATASGLVLALADEAPARPRSLRDDAVNVLTYHGAKGLEWPMVILTGLGKEPGTRLHEPVAEADGDVAWRDPLSGRWLRYWPWPYSSQSTDVHLDSAAPASPLGRMAETRLREEEARLLYVGVTRARDYLVLAPPAKGPLHWLDLLDGDRSGHLSLPREGADTIAAGHRSFPATVLVRMASDDVAERRIEPSYGRIMQATAVRPPLILRPSASGGDEEFEIVEKVTLGPRLPLVGRPDMTMLGEAVHAILAADRVEEPGDVRLARAQGALDRWKVPHVSATDVLTASDRLTAEIRRRFPGATLSRETPVSARLGEQLVRGRIDLLVEHEHGIAIIDHKSFPGSRDSWDERAIGYGPQLTLYAQAVGRARPSSTCELYVHLPLVGGLLRIVRRA
ncbi:UvrD-helicase domain-containing protein [Sphingomonadaceae bacterium OTU29THOMA1]|nr:UvrD-helicase domain-containing protein [Sphingomonadaceae bacterium OTU29THOMA1]